MNALQTGKGRQTGPFPTRLLSRRAFVQTLAALPMMAAPSALFAQQPAPERFDRSVVDTSLRRLASGQLRSIAREPLLVDALRAQNRRTVALSADVIERLDGDWRREIYTPSTRKLVSQVMETPASRYLETIVALSEGLYTEFMLIDAQGLNAALSYPTPDYFQGDEAVWQETYPKGLSGVYLGEYEKNTSTGVWQRQVAFTVANPNSLLPFGVLCAGVAIEPLMDG